MERCQERHFWVLSKPITQAERSVRRELGQQPIGNGPQAFVFFRFLLILGAAGLRLRVFDRSHIDSACVRRLSLRFGFGNGCFVLRPDMAALHAQYTRAIDADKRAGPRDLLGIILDRPIVERGKRGFDLAKPLIDLFGEFVSIRIGLLELLIPGSQRFRGGNLLVAHRGRFASDVS